MKANKHESPKKASKKAEKKALEQSLTTKLFEVVKSLGHDAEKIGEDLILVSKFVAKKISKRVKSGEGSTGKANDAASSGKGAKEAKVKKPGKKQASILATPTKALTSKTEGESKKATVLQKPPVELDHAAISKLPVKKNTSSPRVPKKSEAVLKKVALKPKSITSSVKVNVDPFSAEKNHEHPASEAQQTKPDVKSGSISKPTAKKAKLDPGTDNDQIN